MARGRHSSLWPKATTLETLETGQNDHADTKTTKYYLQYILLVYGH